jgi:hypothetical protein
MTNLFEAVARALALGAPEHTRLFGMHFHVLAALAIGAPVTAARKKKVTDCVGVACCASCYTDGSCGIGCDPDWGECDGDPWSHCWTIHGDVWCCDCVCGGAACICESTI